MAGVLPGVEAARRRRIHQRGHGGTLGGGGSSDYSSCGSVGGASSGQSYNRRPVFSLFAGGFETNPVSAISAERSGMMKKTSEDEMLGRLAREAKGRLDERLKAKRSSLINRNNVDVCEERLRCIDGRTMMARELQTEVFGSSKKKLMLVKWVTKLGGKKATEPTKEEEEECAICLEGFKVGDTLFNLPCSHRFHSSCLLPWLQSHPLCPCCRMTILS